MTLLPKQCQAARVLAELSAEDLAEFAGVSLNTIRRLESGEANPSDEIEHQIIRALQDSGIEFLWEHEDDRGYGVRKIFSTVVVIRRRSWNPDFNRFAFRIVYKDRKITVLVTKEYLEDLDGVVEGYTTLAQLEESFDKNEQFILTRCKRMILAGKVHKDDRLYLEH